MSGQHCWEIEELPETSEDIGAKAASLRLLRQMGLRVPVGLVIGNAHFFQFARAAGVLNRLDLLEKTLWTIAPVHADKLASEIREAFQRTPLDATLVSDLSRGLRRVGLDRGPLVCRSSSSFEDSERSSFPGVFSTYFDIRDVEGLRAAIVACYASLVEPRALNYLRTVRPDSTRFAIAVIVQQQIDSSVAGIAFSREPCTQSDFDTVFVEAAQGRGDALAWGSAVPRQYRIPLHGEPKIVSAAFGERIRHAANLLDDARLRLLGRTCRALRDRIGRHIDAEFAFDGNDAEPFWLQVRPEATRPAPKSFAVRNANVLRTHRGIVCSSGSVIGFGFDARTFDAEPDELSDKIALVESLTLDDYELLCSCRGVVSEDHPSKLNHISIACREIGVPYLGGIGGARQQLHGTALWLDGASGALHELESLPTLGTDAELESDLVREVSYLPVLAHNATAKCVTFTGVEFLMLDALARAETRDQFDEAIVSAFAECLQGHATLKLLVRVRQFTPGELHWFDRNIAGLALVETGVASWLQTLLARIGKQRIELA